MTNVPGGCMLSNGHNNDYNKGHNDEGYNDEHDRDHNNEHDNGHNNDHNNGHEYAGRRCSNRATKSMMCPPTPTSLRNVSDDKRLKMIVEQQGLRAVAPWPTRAAQRQRFHQP